MNAFGILFVFRVAEYFCVTPIILSGSLRVHIVLRPLLLMTGDAPLFNYSKYSNKFNIQFDVYGLTEVDKDCARYYNSVNIL